MTEPNGLNFRIRGGHIEFMDEEGKVTGVQPVSPWAEQLWQSYVEALDMARGYKAQLDAMHAKYEVRPTVSGVFTRPVSED